MRHYRDNGRVIRARSNVAEPSPHTRKRQRSLLRGRARPRLALVTPWPPEESGIADYSFRLVRELASGVEVDVVVSGPLAGFPVPTPPGVRLITAKDYRAAAWRRRRDRVLYCMGNSRFHEHVYELLRARPGPVVLHDAQLTGFFGYYAGRESPQDPLAALVRRVERCYGKHVPRQELETAPLSSQRRIELGIWMTGEIQQHAERIFVHSLLAQEVVERDAGLLGLSVPVSLMPFGMPDPGAAPARSAVAAAPLIVHMGVVSEVKGIALLIEAFALFATAHPGARLVIAGSADESGLGLWEGFARERAPQARVEILGHLDPARYEELLAQADVAVQLRNISNGEASGAVCDCLAAGIPTIVSDLGWMGELPASAVVRVPVDAEPAQLATQIRALVEDVRRRAALSAGAMAHARANSFERVAAAYADVLALA